MSRNILQEHVAYKKCINFSKSNLVRMTSSNIKEIQVIATSYWHVGLTPTTHLSVQKNM